MKRIAGLLVLAAALVPLPAAATVSLIERESGS